jgi:hypothetical protein
MSGIDDGSLSGTVDSAYGNYLGLTTAAAWSTTCGRRSSVRRFAMLHASSPTAARNPTQRLDNPIETPGGLSCAGKVGAGWP